MGRLIAESQDRTSDPNAGLAPLKTAAMERINRNYAGAPNRVTTQLAKRGYAGSGQLPSNLISTENSRLSDLSGLEGTFAQMAADREREGVDLGTRLLTIGGGRDTTGTTPGDSLGSALSAGGSSLGSLSALLTLQRMLKGGGSSDGGMVGLPAGYDPGSYRMPGWDTRGY